MTGQCIEEVVLVYVVCQVTQFQTIQIIISHEPRAALCGRVPCGFWIERITRTISWPDVVKGN